MVTKPRVTVNGVQELDNEKSAGMQALEIAQVVGEILLMIVKMIYFLLESGYRLFVSPPEVSVKGEIVLISGTGHGIGRETAFKYASEGAIIVGCDINKENNDKTISEIKKMGRKAYGYVCDISNRESVFELAARVKKDVGEVTILVNNAGIMPTKPLLKQTVDEIDKTFKINVYAHFWTLQAFLPDMIKNNKGHIVALSSCAGLIGLENIVPYCASKFAVRGMMEALFMELRAQNKASNIKFTIIYPYIVDTGLCKKPKIRFEKYMPIQSPKHVAELIVASQRKGVMETTIPQYVLPMNVIMSMGPRKNKLVLSDFLQAGLEPDS